MDKYCEYCKHDERHRKIKLIIEIEKDYFEMIKYDAEHGHNYKYFEIIANGIPYDKVIDEVTELLENEWGYEGMRDDVSRIMRGGNHKQEGGAE